jgi:hypothetical protein
MTSLRTEYSEQPGNRTRTARRVGISGVPDDTKESVFCEWAGSPGTPPRFGKPLMGPVMLNMTAVYQRYQDIDIQEKPGQLNSSRN